MSLTRRCRVANTEHVGPDLSGKRPVHSLHFVVRNAAFPDKSGPTGFSSVRYFCGV